MGELCPKTTGHDQQGTRADDQSQRSLWKQGQPQPQPQRRRTTSESDLDRIRRTTGSSTWPKKIPRKANPRRLCVCASDLRATMRACERRAVVRVNARTTVRVCVSRCMNARGKREDERELALGRSGWEGAGMRRPVTPNCPLTDRCVPVSIEKLGRAGSKQAQGKGRGGDSKTQGDQTAL
jgi:hypothetical protein